MLSRTCLKKASTGLRCVVGKAVQVGVEGSRVWVHQEAHMAFLINANVL